MTPDPLGGNVANPQSLNRYAYVLNDPESLVDPLGLFTSNPTFCQLNPDICYGGGGGAGNSAPDGSGGGCTIFTAPSSGNCPVGNGGNGPLIGNLPLTRPPSQQLSLMMPACEQGLAEAGATQAAISRALQNWSAIRTAANDYSIDPRMLAAVGVRESGFLDRNQAGGGPGVGVYQLTVSPGSGITAAQANDFTFSTFWAAGKLAFNIGYMSVYFPNFTPSQGLQAAAAAYNFGVHNISGNPATIDRGTAHGNYGIDILLLINCF